MIKNIFIGNFGKLRDFYLELDGGLNVIYGKNEAGKSTIASFIRAMLYSMPNKNVKGGEVISPRARFEPWQMSDMSGSMAVKSREKEYIIERRFKDRASADILRVIDALTQKETDALSNVPGEKLYAMGEKTFEKTAFVGQMSVATEKTQEMVSRLSNLMSTMDEEISFEKADGILKSVRTKIKTGDNSVLNALANKKLAINRELDEAKARQSQCAQLFLKREELGFELVSLEGSLKELQQEKLLFDAKAAGGDYEKIVALEEEIGLLEKNISGTREKLRFAGDGYVEKLNGEKREFDSINLKLGMLKDETEKTAARIDERDGVILGRELKKDGLPLHEWMQNIKSRMEYLRAQMNLSDGKKRRQGELETEIGAIKDEQYSLFERNERELSDFLSKARPTSRYIPAILALLGLLSAIAGIFIHPLFFVLCALFAVLCAFSVPSVRRGKAALKKYGQRKLSGLKGAYLLYLQKKERIIALESELGAIALSHDESAEQEEKSLKEQMEKYLLIVGEPDEQKAIDKARILYSMELERDSLIKRKEELTSQMIELDLQKDIHENSIEVMLAEARNSGIDESGPDELIEYIAKASAQAEKDVLLAQNKIESRKNILGGRTLEDVVALKDLYKSGASYRYDQAGGYENEQGRLLKQVNFIKNEQANVAGLIDGMFEGEKEIGVIEEELALADEAMEEAQKRAKAIELAINVLKESYSQVSASFSPEITALTNEYLKRASGGKYERLTIDSDYLVRVYDGSDPIPKELFGYSRGTMDQIYICLRLALLKYLSGGMAVSPLIFDDSFANCDDERLQNLMKILWDESKERQIIILTCQRRETEALKGIGDFNEIVIG